MVRTRSMANGNSRRVTPNSNRNAPNPVTIADYAEFLSQLRTTLGPDRISSLPQLSQLTFSTVKSAQSPCWLPLTLLVGYYVSPNDQSPHTGLPVYVYLDSTDAAEPNIFAEVVAADCPRIGALRQSRRPEKRKGFYDWELFVECVHFLPCFAAMTKGHEFEAQIRYCFLLAAEAKVHGFTGKGVPIGKRMKAVLISLCTEDVEDALGSVTRSLADPISSEPKRTAVDRETQTDGEGDVVMVEHGTQVEEDLAVMKDQETQTPTRMDLQQYVKLRKAQGTSRRTYVDGASYTDTATQNQSLATPAVNISSISEASQASRSLTSTTQLTAVQLQSRRAWSSILSQSIQDRLGQIQDMKAKNEQKRTLMHKLLRASSPLTVQKMAAEVGAMARRIGEEQLKVKKWAADKHKVDEQLEKAKVVEH